MPCLIASAGEAIDDRLAVQPDLALVGLVEPVEDAHQRALAGAVLAEAARAPRRRRTSKSTWSLATTPGKRLVMPRISSNGAAAVSGALPGVATSIVRPCSDTALAHFGDLDRAVLDPGDHLLDRRLDVGREV